MKRKGFTLVEVIAAISIFAIISAVITGFFSQSIRLLFNNRDGTEIAILHKNNLVELKKIQRNCKEVTIDNSINLQGGKSLIVAKDKENEEHYAIITYKKNKQNTYDIYSTTYFRESGDISTPVKICENIKNIKVEMDKDKAVLFYIGYDLNNVKRQYEFSIKEQKEENVEIKDEVNGEFG